MNELFETIVQVVAGSRGGETGLLAAEKAESLAIEEKLKAIETQRSKQSMGNSTTEIL